MLISRRLDDLDRRIAGFINHRLYRIRLLRGAKPKTLNQVPLRGRDGGVDKREVRRSARSRRRAVR
jgi:hypothetical protein